MLEFVFGVIVGILLVWLYFELKVKGDIADELTLTIAGYTLYIKKLDEGSNQQNQPAAKSSKSRNLRANKYTSNLQQRDESNVKQEDEGEKLSVKSPSKSLKNTSLKNTSLKTNSAPTNLNSPRTAQSPNAAAPKEESGEVQGDAQAEAPKEVQRESAKEVQREFLKEVQRESPREVQNESPREVAPKNPRSPIGSFPGKATPSLYLSPDLGNNRSKQLDVVTGRSASDANLSEAKSPKVAYAKVTKNSGRQRSVYLAPTMGQEGSTQLDVTTARGSTQEEDLGGESPSKSPKVTGKASRKAESSLYLSPSMTNNNRSQQYDLITAKSASKEDARR